MPSGEQAHAGIDGAVYIPCDVGGTLRPINVAVRGDQHLEAEPVSAAP